ncbi:MAG: WD40 repeat domain-containing protein [Planctomycetes bacterium]|nr:WD40 repeat domain-containing protein [Planctomycetota bacterium]
MKIPIQCRCGRTYKVSPGARPRQARCAACGAALVIPALPTISPKPRREFRRLFAGQGRKFKLGLGLASGIVILGGTVYGVFAWRAHSALAAEIDKIREAGQPVELAELAPEPIPDGENAARVYERAFEALREAEWEDDDALSAFAEPWPVPDYRGIQAGRALQFLDENKEALSLAREAARRPRCQFGLAWEKGLFMELPHLSKLKNLAGLLEADAVRWSRLGRTDEALASLEALFACGRALEEEPMLIGHLVRCAIFGKGCAALRTILAERPPAAEDALPWIEFLGNLQDRKPFVRALMAERCFVIWIAERLFEDPEFVGEVVQVGGYTLPGATWSLRYDIAFYLQCMAEYIELAACPYHEVLPELEALGDRVEEGARSHILTSMLIPAMAAVAMNQATCEARLELARTALAVAVDRETRGSWAPGLADLPGLSPGPGPLDPATGRPLELRVDGMEAKLSSPRPDFDEYDRLDEWTLSDARLVGCHTDPVEAVAWSPDGRLLATGCRDGAVGLWEAESGREVHILRGHEKPVLSIAFSADGKLLASGAKDGSLRVWDVAGGHLLRVLYGDKDGVDSVAFHPDGTWLAAGGATLKTWTVASWEEFSFGEYPPYVGAIAFGPGGSWLAAASSDVAVWDSASREKIRSWPGRGKWLSAIAVAPDGRQVAAGGGDQVVLVWDFETGSLSHVLGPHEEWVSSVAFSTGGRLLVSAGDPDRIRIWNPASGREIGTRPVRGGRVSSIAFSPSANALALADSAPYVTVWPLAKIEAR